jgi:glyoxylase-like metal-dependent hydrolase (beta-lactamase superfamily II)
LEPYRASKAIQSYLGPDATRLQHIRFIDFIYKDNGFRFTIAVIWTDSYPSVRNRLYFEAKEIVRKTGWYPLPQGERLNSSRWQRNFRAAIGSPVLQPRIGGKLCALESAVDEDGGCAIRIVTDDGNFLVDTGLPGRLSPSQEDRFVLISHEHLDHTGNLLATLDLGLPVAMSVGTAQVMIATTKVTIGDLRGRIRLLEHGKSISLKCGIAIHAFAVPHSPGSSGFVITDGQSRIVFSGDICLRTHRHNFLSELFTAVTDGPELEKYLLLDSTMAARTEGASDTDVASSAISALSECDDLVISSFGGDHLMYAYIDLFQRLQREQRHNTEFMLHPSLRGLFESVHASFMSHRDHLDPFILSQYAATRSAWGESRWLFWLNRERLKPSSFKRIWFVPIQELDQVTPKTSVGIVYIGRGDFPVHFPWSATTKSYGFDTSAWTLHSDSQSLKNAISSYSGKARVFLFHDFPRRLTRFIKKTGVDAQPITKDRIRL